MLHERWAGTANSVCGGRAPLSGTTLVPLMHFMTRAAQGVMGIADVDTRAITRRLRTNGCLNGVITTDDSLTDEELIAKTRVRVATPCKRP